MDQDRQIRFLIPPFFLYTSLLWWAYIDPSWHCSLSVVFGANLKELVPILAAAGAATIPIGYSIGTLGVLALKGFFWLFFGGRSKGHLRQLYEAWISREAFTSILLVTKAPDNPLDDKRPNLLYAVATFDHELLPERIHEWIRRHLNAFVVAFNSALAIVIALIVVKVRSYYAEGFDPLCGLSKTQWQQQASWALAWDNRKCWWVAVNLLLCVLLFVAASISWWETMRMIDFQTLRRNTSDSRSQFFE